MFTERQFVNIFCHPYCHLLVPYLFFMVFHCFSWFFMVFMVFHGFSPKCTCPNCILARRSNLGPPPGGRHGTQYTQILAQNNWEYKISRIHTKIGTKHLGISNPQNTHNYWHKMMGISNPLEYTQNIIYKISPSSYFVNCIVDDRT